MNPAYKEGAALILGKRLSRAGRIKADETVTDQLGEQGTPGHRDFVRHHAERVAPPVIGSSLPESVRAAASRIGTFLRLS